MHYGRRTLGVVAAGLVFLVGGPALADTDATAEERIAELERKVTILSGEIEKVQFADAFLVPEDSIHGMGPSASKIYRKESGVSIGGYGEGLYSDEEGGGDEADFLRAILYVGYKFTPQWVLNTEIEFEHASTSEEGSVSVEFAYLDYLAHEALNFRAGLLLVPVGLVNELHEPNVFLGARRPETEQRIIPSTWRENGLGFFGDIGLVSYKAYVVNGFEGANFTDKGLRGGRQKGSEAKADDLAGVLRVDVTPATGVMLGGSAYYGDSGQDIEPSVPTEVYEAHLDAARRGFQLRGLVSLARVDDVAELNMLRAEPLEDGSLPATSMISSIGEELTGWYVEAGYNLFNRCADTTAALTPFVRYEEVDTQSQIPAGFKRSAANDFSVTTLGVSLEPTPGVVFKADYQLYDDAEDLNLNRFNLAMGYVF